MVKLNIVGGGGADIDAYRLGDDKSNGFGLRFPHGFGGGGAPLGVLQQLVRLC